MTTVTILEKIAAEGKDTSPLYDFMAGVEPTGTYTFEAARKNKGKHGLHRLSGVTGGVNALSA